ncbi:MAG: AMP-binding protein, partial [Paracoccaceae bacterium]|nr:AMP-binding protein [Paracoccaceae bacterium]
MANAAQYFVSRHSAGPLANKTAFREAQEGGAEITYGELDAQSDRMIGFFADHGLRREDRVAMLVLDEIAYPVAFFGALKSGVVPILLNTLLATPVYEAILNDCRARALFVSAALYPVVEPILAANQHLEKVFVIGGDAPSGTLSFEAEFAKVSPGPMIDTSDDETAFWLYSSGSTGTPKGVLHAHGSMKATADTYGA